MDCELHGIDVTTHFEDVAEVYTPLPNLNIGEFPRSARFYPHMQCPYLSQPLFAVLKIAKEVPMIQQSAHFGE